VTLLVLDEELRVAALAHALRIKLTKISRQVLAVFKRRNYE